jgi:tryptophan synthase beta chain
MRWLSRTEGILPALESAHALAVLPRLLVTSGAAWADETIVLVGLSGRGDKDLASFGAWLAAAER